MMEMMKSLCIYPSHKLYLLLLIVKFPFNKIKIIRWATIALEKRAFDSYMYSNPHLNSRETVPLIFVENIFLNFRTQNLSTCIKFSFIPLDVVK